MREQSQTESIIQQQLDAYNPRDLERLVQLYAEDAEIYEHPATLLAKGSAQIRARFIARFQEPNLHAKLINRMVVGKIVVDQEIVTRTFPEGPGRLELIMIYEVRGGRIAQGLEYCRLKEF